MYNPDNYQAEQTAAVPAHGQNEANRSVPATEQPGFELPGWIWQTMLAAYGIFFTALFLATGRDSTARFALVVSIGYTVMYFATARILNAIKGREQRSPLARSGGTLDCATGQMDLTAVAAQVLTVPLCVAGFAVSILIIRVLLSA